MTRNKEIPKIIHYCWFGDNELSPLMVRCIESWRKFMPQYTIKEWNESNFNINSNDYIREAYSYKKYAFVSDYARMKILYEYGGIYLDTDVELLKSLTPLVEKGPFMGCEQTASSGLGVAPGLGMAAYPGMPILLKFIQMYDCIHFIVDGRQLPKNIVHYTMDILRAHGLRITDEYQVILGDLQILPKKYLCPKDYNTGKLNISPETFSIHHYSYSWADLQSLKVYNRKKRIFRILPPKTAQIVFNVYNHLCKLLGK